jgi:hypothetical protein
MGFVYAKMVSKELTVEKDSVHREKMETVMVMVFVLITSVFAKKAGLGTHVILNSVNITVTIMEYV